MLVTKAVIAKNSSWMLILPAVLALACGTRDIKKPAPPAQEELLDAARVPGVKLDAAPFKPMSLDATVIPSADAADGSPGDTTPDGPAECDPVCSMGNVCNNGQCESVCIGTQTLCKSGCADVASDPRNCGQCEGVCGPGEYCSKGLCVVSCAEGETKCGQSCVNLATDRANCGACGKSCAGAEACTGGLCLCTGSNMICSGVCQSVQNNRNDCGSCGNRCTGDLVCNDRTCGCARGRTRCPNNQTKCVANLNDCCPAGQVWCGNRCVVLFTDDDNCGRCGRVCPGAQRCNAGTCGCPSNQPRSCPGNICLPSSQCCSNQTKCADNSCVANTTCCPGQRRCSNDSCIPSASCCPDERACGDKCISNAASVCCPTDADPCGMDGTRTCNASNQCVCVFQCPGNKCAANAAGCCDGGETLCGNACCPATHTCVMSVCKAPPPPPPDASPPSGD